MGRPRPAEFPEGGERIILAITASVDGKRVRLAVGKPKILRRAGLTPELRQQTCGLAEKRGERLRLITGAETRKCRLPSQ